MSKKLTPAKLESARKKAYTMKTVALEDITGEIWEVTIDKNMSPSKAEDMAKDLINFLIRVRQENEAEEPDIAETISENLYAFLLIYTLKYYTDIPIVEKKTTKETVLSYINVINGLYDMGIVEKIKDEFGEESLRKTYKIATDYINNIENVMKQMADEELAKQNLVEQPNEEPSDNIVEVDFENKESEDKESE